MSYTVTWEPEAEQALAAIWTSARDPVAVTAAADQIDWLLERDPLSEGESRDDPYRIMIVSPLGVTFEVDETSREVWVYHVWRTRRAK
jgi:hypothetical protein